MFCRAAGVGNSIVRYESNIRKIEIWAFRPR
jgi:hypothetical protein